MPGANLSNASAVGGFRGVARFEIRDSQFRCVATPLEGEKRAGGNVVDLQMWSFLSTGLRSVLLRNCASRRRVSGNAPQSFSIGGLLTMTKFNWVGGVSRFG